MSKIDARGKLQENPFSYLEIKTGKILVYYKGRQIMMLNEKESQRLKKKIEGRSEFDVQLALAKVTGNFKHGNERGK